MYFIEIPYIYYPERSTPRGAEKVKVDNPRAPFLAGVIRIDRVREAAPGSRQAYSHHGQISPSGPVNSHHTSDRRRYPSNQWTNAAWTRHVAFPACRIPEKQETLTQCMFNAGTAS